MKTWVLATHNAGKLCEFQEYFEPLGVKLIPQSQLDISPAEETALTFIENALQKARHVAQFTDLPVLADDSGLVVDALNGAPGIYSARYAGENASAEVKIKKLLDELNSVPDEKRMARFFCALVLLKKQNDPTPVICQGIWEGKILQEPYGVDGFGYDPIFFVPTHNCSAAELPLHIKNRISHRAKALQQLLHVIN
jgi:XTP/dITP diphosphohydrolase